MAQNTETGKSLRIAIAQLPITADARQNGKAVRAAMRQAAKGGARLVQFPEGMLSGYAKEQLKTWDEVNWTALRQELEGIIQLAGKLKIWTVLGCNHQLTPPHWPHNSLYIISDQGVVINRYDKRIVSYTEVTQFYTPGSESVVFEVDGYRFGCVICIEINFPQLFIEYAQLGVDCLLFSAYPVDAIFSIKAQAYAAIHNYWLALATPTQTASFIKSALIGPDGKVLTEITTEQGLIFAELDPSTPQFDIPLTKSKPWRTSVATDPRYQTKQLNDPRSVNHTVI